MEVILTAQRKTGMKECSLVREKEERVEVEENFDDKVRKGR